MYQTLSSLLEKPPLYTKNTIPFWNDTHISKQMLKAHLDPDFEGASRKLSFIEQSVRWISDTVPASSYRQLIDIGCGPGIYAEKFTAEGYQVTGVDFSTRSIEYAIRSAKEKNTKIQYFCQDYLQLELSQTFDLATMIYCDYGVLSTADRKVLMRKVYSHLRKGGKFLLDVFSIASYDSFEEGQTWELCENGGFWSQEPYFALHGRYKYPENATLEHTVILREEEARNYYLNQRIIAGNAQFTGIAAGRGVGFTTGLLLLREGLGMRETPIRPHSWH